MNYVYYRVATAQQCMDTPAKEKMKSKESDVLEIYTEACSSRKISRFRPEDALPLEIVKRV